MIWCDGWSSSNIRGWGSSNDWWYIWGVSNKGRFSGSESEESKQSNDLGQIQMKMLLNRFSIGIVHTKINLYNFHAKKKNDTEIFVIWFTYQLEHFE